MLVGCWAQLVNPFTCPIPFGSMAIVPRGKLSPTWYSQGEGSILCEQARRPIGEAPTWGSYTARSDSIGVHLPPSFLYAKARGMG